MNKALALASVVLMLWLGATTTQAQTIDFRTYKCSEFIALPEDTLDLVAVWLDGFLSDDEDPESMKVDFSGTDADEIKAYCANHPNILLSKAAEQTDEVE